MNKSDYDKYYRKGGEYVIPVEIFNELFDERDELQQRVDKAIEYLKLNACIDEEVEYFNDDLRYDECKELLDILKGNDN